MKKSEYIDLIKQIKYHDDLYYNQSQPEITDSEYDKLYFKLQSYEKDHPDKISNESPTQKVSNEKTINKIQHPYPLLSLKKANTYDAVEKYLDQFTDEISAQNDHFVTKDFMLQLKEDGLTIALYYNWFPNQPFVAATRGGGSEGQDVTLQMNSFAKKISTKKPLVIRGEAILTNDAFDELNENGVYMNPRNAVSGLLHTDEEASNITFVAYNIENAEDLNITTEQEMLSQLNKWGFTTPQIQEVFPNSTQGKDELIEYIKGFEKENKRLSIDHDIDGLVIKPTYIANRRILGYTSHHPKNQLAYKFASPDAITKLKNVIWQNGAKGHLTPVGIFDEIVLLGAKITKASLANYGNIQRRDIKIGDEILVRRSNDVIPQIVKSFPNKRTGKEINIEIPDDAYFNGKHLFTSKISDEQLINQWKIFISKNGLNIERISQKTIKDLAHHGLIDLYDFSSLWNITSKRTNLINLNHWSDVKADNLLNQLNKPIKVTMPEFLVALALNGIGPDTAKKISKLYPTIPSIINAQPAMTIEEWHDTVGNLSNTYLNEIELKNNQIKNLAPHIEIIKSHLSTTTTQSLDHKTFVITGKAINKSRNEIKTLIESANGKVINTVNKNTDYLIELTPNTISSKTTKAKQLDIPIINEDDFLNMI